MQECEPLEQLMLRASQTIPGYREEMHAHPEAFHVSPQQIGAGRILVAEVDGGLAGFASWRPMGDLTAELDGVFIERSLGGSGLGTDLTLAICAAAASNGYKNLFATVVPGALGLFRRCGFVRTGATATSLGPMLTMIKEIAEP